MFLLLFEVINTLQEQERSEEEPPEETYEDVGELAPRQRQHEPTSQPEPEECIYEVSKQRGHYIYLPAIKICLSL